MTQGEIEKAKLHANYWNGLAITTMAIGVLPLFLETGAQPPTPDLAEVIIQAFGRLAFAVPLSLLFHAAAIRSIRGI
jgi:hypothetical protein